MIIRMVGMTRFIGDLRNLLTLYDLGDMDPNPWKITPIIGEIYHRLGWSASITNIRGVTWVGIDKLS
jgi:hypothetical protein